MKTRATFCYIICLIYTSTSAQSLQSRLSDDPWSLIIGNDQNLSQNTKFRLSVFNTNGQYFNSGFALGDAFIESENQLNIDLTKVVDQVASNNDGRVQVNVNTIDLAIKIGNGWIQGGHNVKHQGSLSYTEPLARLFAYGNAEYIGQTVSVGPKAMYQSYHEIYLGTVIELSRITLGFKFKYLSGNEHFSTSSSRIDLETESDYYALNLTTDYEINTSSLLKYNGLNDVSFDLDPFRLNPLFSGNNGAAIDAGISFKIGEKNKVGIQVKDLGIIKWDKNTENYVSRGEYTYSGIDLLDFLSDDYTVNLSDSLYNLLDFQTISGSSYTTSIPYYLTLSYFHAFSDKLVFLGEANYQKFPQQSFLAFNLGGQYSVSNAMDFLLNYTAISGSYNNLGIGTRLRLGPISIFAGVDNILPITNIINNKYGGFYFGMVFRN